MLLLDTAAKYVFFWNNYGYGYMRIRASVFGYICVHIRLYRFFRIRFMSLLVGEMSFISVFKFYIRFCMRICKRVSSYV